MKRIRYGPFVALVAVLLSMPTTKVAAQEVMCPVPLVEDIPCNGFDPDKIPTEFPFEPKRVRVLDSFMAYIEAGEGDPILFIHGQPTYSYTWRNIIPFAEPYGHAIAVDLIGMGRSGKPDIPYRFQDHLAYLEAFIEALGLRRITLVIIDWGGPLGLSYARKHPGKVRAVAFLETLVFDPPGVPFPSAEDLGDFGQLLLLLRTPGVGEDLIFNQNIFVEGVLPVSIGTRISTRKELDFYNAPYPEPTDVTRRPQLQWPREFPLEGEPADTAKEIVRGIRWLKRTPIPKLVFYAEPGFLIPPALADYLADTMKNIETHFIGPGIHYLPEQNPKAIGLGLADWLRRNNQKKMRTDDDDDDDKHGHGQGHGTRPDDDDDDKHGHGAHRRPFDDHYHGNHRSRSRGHSY